MNNLVSVSFIAIYLFGAVFPLGSAEPITATIGFISSVLSIISYFQSLQTADNTFFSLMHAIGQYQISEKLSNIERALEKINERLPKQIAFNIQMDVYYRLTKKIDDEYTYMLGITQAYANGTRQNRSDRETTKSNIERYFTNNPDTPTSIATDIYFTFADKRSIVLQFIQENMQDNQISACTRANELRSYQQILQNLVTSVVISQVKVYLTLKMAATYTTQTKGEYPISDFESKINRLQKEYEDTVKLFKQLMSGASRDVWACDPKQHIENETFIQLQNVFQRQIVDYYAFDPPPNKNLFTAGRTKQLEKIDPPGEGIRIGPFFHFDVAADVLREIKGEPYTKEEKYHDVITNEDKELDNVSSYVHYNTPLCKGYLWDCEPLTHLLEESEDDKFLVCHSVNNSSRRFDRIEVQHVNKASFIWWRQKRIEKITATYKRAFGSQKPCYPTLHKRSFIDNSPVCICDETTSVAPTIVRSDYSYRFFYTNSVSTQNNNYVVTGARIGQYKGVIYPIIQEGQLLQEGVVNQSTLRWIDIAQDKKRKRLLMIPQNLEKIDWSDRTIKLGDVDLPTGQVLTGLYFTRANDELDGLLGPLRLALIWQKFDFKTGVVAPPEGDFQQIADNYGKENTERFDYIQSDIVPVGKLPLPNLNDQSNNIVCDGFLNFTTSDFTTDLGQTTVPYFDVQNVTTEIPTPMGGAGLYYKYRPDHVGFIGIKLKTYDISPHFTEPTDELSSSMKIALKDEASFREGNLGIIQNQIE